MACMPRESACCMSGSPCMEYVVAARSCVLFTIPTFNAVLQIWARRLSVVSLYLSSPKIEAECDQEPLAWTIVSVAKCADCSELYSPCCLLFLKMNAVYGRLPSSKTYKAAFC